MPRAKLMVAMTFIVQASFFISCTKTLKISSQKPNSGERATGTGTPSGDEGEEKKMLEQLNRNGYPLGDLDSSEHPSFPVLARLLESIYPSARAESAPANPERKVYTIIAPSTWGDGHAIECMIKNVSPELSNPGVNPIDATAIVELAVRAESGQYRNSQNMVFPHGNYTNYERRLQPGETWMLVWSIGNGPPLAPNGTPNVIQQFPRGLQVIVKNVDPARKGLIQGRCVHWWSNGGYNHDIPIFGGFPF